MAYVAKNEIDNFSQGSHKLSESNVHLDLYDWINSHWRECSEIDLRIGNDFIYVSTEKSLCQIN